MVVVTLDVFDLSTPLVVKAIVSNEVAIEGLDK